MVTDEDIVALKRWAEHMGDAARAALGLLIEHDHWLWSDAFAERCVRRAGGEICLDFGAMAQLWFDGTACSEGQAAILLAAADIGSGRWRIATLDYRNCERLVRAVAVATGHEPPRTVTYDMSDPDTHHVVTQAFDDYQEKQRDLAADGDNKDKRITWADLASKFRDRADEAAAR